MLLLWSVLVPGLCPLLHQTKVVSYSIKKPRAASLFHSMVRMATMMNREEAVLMFAGQHGQAVVHRGAVVKEI